MDLSAIKQIYLAVCAICSSGGVMLSLQFADGGVNALAVRREGGGGELRGSKNRRHNDGNGFGPRPAGDRVNER